MSNAVAPAKTTTPKAAPKQRTPRSITPAPPAPTPTTLAEALAEFQHRAPKIQKGQTATIPGKEGKSGYRYDYADLTDIVEVCSPILGELGLSVSGKTKVDKRGMFVLQTTLLHTSGESIKSTYPLPDPLRTAPQAFGSSLTYARRYTFVTLTGVAPGGDDDDAQSMQVTGQATGAVMQPQRAVEPAEIEWLPEGEYDLADITTRDKADAVYQRAVTAGHLKRAIMIDGKPMQFGQWLIGTGRALKAAEEQAAAEAAAGDDDAEAQAIAEHEAAMLAAEAAEAAGEVHEQ